MAKRKKQKLTVKNAQKVKPNPTVSRNYKDTIFRKLFSDKKICCLFIMLSMDPHMKNPMNWRL